MNSVLGAIAMLGIIVTGFSVLIGKLALGKVVGRIFWWLFALACACIALSMVEQLVVVPLVAAARASVPIFIKFLLVFLALLLLVAAVAGLSKLFLNRSVGEDE